MMKSKYLRGFGLVLAGAFLLLGCSGCGYIRSLFNSLFGGSRKSGAINSEIAYQQARGRVVGEFLKNVAPGKKLVIIADPKYVQADNDKKDRFTTALIDALYNAYGSGETAVVSVRVPENAEEEGIPLSDFMTPTALDALIPADAGIVVFMNCMPENPRNMKIFTAQNGPKAVLIGRGGATNKFLADKIKSGEILGLVVGRPKVKYSEPADSNYKKAFDFRYVLINKDNVDSNAEFFK